MRVTLFGIKYSSPPLGAQKTPGPREYLCGVVSLDEPSKIKTGGMCMATTDVRVVQLKAMRVASVQVIGPSPEMAAWQKLKEWATSKSLLGTGTKVRLFGFNNPDPEPGKQDYGYELWLVVGAKMKADAWVKIKDFPGGKYAVLQVKGAENIPGAWQELLAWGQTEHHQIGEHQPLEEFVTLPDVSPDELTLNLCMPIK